MNAFSFERWRLLVGRHWAENKKRYLLSFFAFIGLLIFWFAFVLLMTHNFYVEESIQLVTYFVCLFIAGAFYASQFFSDLGSQPKGINYLLTPASTLEKIACTLFYVVLLFFVFLTLAFYIVDVSMVALANTLQATLHHDESLTGQSKVVNVFMDTKHNADSYNINYYFLLLFFAVQSFFLLGSAYFSKYSFVKTAITIFLLLLGAFFIEAYVMDSFLPKGSHSGNFTTYLTFKGDWTPYKIVTLPAWINRLLTTLLFYAFPPLFWIVTYFRVKEKEV